MQKISPMLWFDTQAEEAANFYVSIFKDSKINTVVRYPDAGQEVTGKPAGSVMTVSFQLAGQTFTALNGGPQFKFNESISFVVDCEDQAEIDYFWEKLSAHPESEQCGWLKDKFGLSWQIVPKQMGELVISPKAMEAMLSMKKIDIAELQRANQQK
jgi:predicted 3-demethylubiquinone-9 3-methyltransferase (glyoxalase superfamily)